jgi:GR25 family glycosyltransferase involved in LPS biosynthesis
MSSEYSNAWKIAATENKLTIIVEADFVPVVRFGQLPLPFNPNKDNVGIAWLYTCASQVYSVSDEGYAEGFSTSMVGYIVTSKAAKCLLELEAQIRNNPGPTVYSTWDSSVDNFLRAKGFKNYIPFRNYGEHGGLPNLEHQKHGLSKTHRADVLYDKLAFMPMYVTGKNNQQLQLLSVRIKARLKGLARLLLGKFLRIPVIKGSSFPLRLILFAIMRQISMIL